MLELIEWAGRKCYKSEEKIVDGSAEKFVRRLLSCTPPHESVIEHVSATVLFVVDRGVTHELVRHRIASFSQESTRFCDYDNHHVTFVIPSWMPSCVVPGTYANYYNIYDMAKAAEETCPGAEEWLSAMLYAECAYKHARAQGWRPEQARSILPTSLKTEIVTTCNLRQWRHIFEMRTAAKCHPQMLEVMRPLAMEFLKELPEIFSEQK